MLLKVSGKYIVYDFENNRIVSSTLKLKDKAANEDYCVANGNVAYTVNNNLYVNEQDTDEPEGIVCATKSHRNEFGINKAPSGARKATCSLSTAWTKAWLRNTLVDITACRKK